MKVIALVTARSGSKGVPDKNIKKIQALVQKKNSILLKTRRVNFKNISILYQLKQDIVNMLSKVYVVYIFYIFPMFYSSVSYVKIFFL